MIVSTAADAGVLSPDLPCSTRSPKDVRVGACGADDVSERLDRRRVPTHRRHYRERADPRDLIRTAALVDPPLLWLSVGSV